MRILIIGPYGRLGTAVREALSARHELVTASRSSGDVNVDISSPQSIAAMYEEIGRVDAVACAAGGAPYKPLSELS